MLSQTMLTVSQLNRYVKSLLDGDFRLKDVLIRGEISNFVDHYKSGHFYFTLKEGDCAVKSVMFASYATNIPFHPENGMAVIVRGTVSLYERDGSYQMYVYDMQPEGKGSLQAAYEQLLAKLKNEGLFDPDRKKAIPSYPETVGIITSDTGAALHDMVTILNRRFPPARLVLYPALVQGVDAPKSLIGGLRYFNRTKSCDVILIGRGGGSLEDLWAFNNEELVREVTNSQIPVISAVGHETDFTLCDFAADLRAPTPSAAAELAVPDCQALLRQLGQKEAQIKASVQSKLFATQQRYDSILERGPLKNWKTYFEPERQHLDYLAGSLKLHAEGTIGMKQEQLRSRMDQLTILNPWERLKKGYSITSGPDGRPLRSVAETACGQLIVTDLADGRLVSHVEKIEPASREGES